MIDRSERELRELAEVDRALSEMELVEAPIRLSAAVMERLRASIPLPHFRLKWIDYFLGAFAAVMLAAGFLVTQTLPPFFELTIRQEINYWLIRFMLQPLPPLLLLAALVVGAGCALLVANMAVRVIREEDFSRRRPASQE